MSLIPTLKIKQKHLERFNILKISKQLTSKLKTIPVINSSKFNSARKNKQYKSNNILISNVLRASKSLLINEEDNKVEEKIPDNINYKYPYRPLYFYNIDNNINWKKIIALSNDKSFQRNLSFISNTKKSNRSLDNISSTFKSSKDISLMNNLFNNSSNKKIEYNFINHKIKPNKIVKQYIINKKILIFSIV